MPPRRRIAGFAASKRLNRDWTSPAPRRRAGWPDRSVAPTRHPRVDDLHLGKLEGGDVAGSDDEAVRPRQLGKSRQDAACQQVARRHYELLSGNPKHPSLRFKKVGALDVGIAAHVMETGADPR